MILCQCCESFYCPRINFSCTCCSEYTSSSIAAYLLVSSHFIFMLILPLQHQTQLLSLFSTRQSAQLLLRSHQTRSSSTWILQCTDRFICHHFNIFNMFELAKTVSHEYLGLNSAVLHLAKSLFIIFHFTPDAIIYCYIFLFVESFLQYKGGTVNISL